jgi:D-arabinan exo alpha-(1,3)/(1,5)-arabinofuranosidase (non-reducing end)
VHMTLQISTLLFLLALPVVAPSQNLYDLPPGVETRWFSFENPGGVKGQGGRANEGRKGAPSRAIKAGEKVILADVAGPGTIRRIWCTLRGKPEFLRGMVIRMYWDGSSQPAVEVPLQDFFGVPFARQVKFESAFFSNPEARSFNSFVPMPFKKSARIVVENQAPEDVPDFFYDIDATVGDRHPEKLAYFLASYRRENPTTPKRDFEILPRIEGEGRYLGSNVGIRSISPYGEPHWFGEGELKIFVDNDREFPTLVGTGTEDLVGSAWGLGKFSHQYQGCLLSEKEDGVWGFYRYHIPDPVYFRKGVRVTLQQMAGGTVQDLSKLSPRDYPELVNGHRRFNPSDFNGKDREWRNFEAPMDVCATAYWYQVPPLPALPPLEPYESRIRDLGHRNPK